MGPRISIEDNIKQIEKYLKNSRKIDDLHTTDNPLNSTILRNTTDDGPIVIKEYMDSLSDRKFLELQEQMQRNNGLFDTQNKHPNTILYSRESPLQLALTGKEKNVLVLRQYICFNLHEKMTWLPPPGLSLPEKMWLIFQLMCSVQQCHSVGLTHGNIKPENILVNSYNWVFLSDIATNKPVVCKDDNLELYNKFFGELSNNNRCYFAPERWRSKDQSIDEDNVLHPQMDIFSMGCVIAEILMDGMEGNQSLFNLARLQLYRNGEQDPRQELRKGGVSDEIADLIMKMIHFHKDDNPKTSRPTAEQCIQDWIDARIFPRSYSQVFFQIGAAFLRPKNFYSDNRIGLVRYHINSIFEACFDIKNAFTELNFKEHLDPAIFNLLQEDNSIIRYEEQDMLIPSSVRSPAFKFLGENRKNPLPFRNEEDRESAEHSCVVVVQWIGALFTSCFNPQMKLVALEILLKLAQKMPFEFRLNQVLPWVMQAFSRAQASDNIRGKNKHLHTTRVRVRAFEIVLEMFEDILDCTEEIYVMPADYIVFSAYILKEFLELKTNDKHDLNIQLVFAKNLAKIAQIGHRFLEISVGSCLKRREQARKKKQKEEKKVHKVETSQIIMEVEEDMEQTQVDPVSSMQLSHILRRKSVMGKDALNFGKMSVEEQNEEEQPPTMGSLATETHRKAQFQRSMSSVRPSQMLGTEEQEQLYEEIVLNYDEERRKLFQTVQSFIDDFAGYGDTQVFILMLKCMGDLSQLFGVELTETKLIPQCTSGFNQNDFRVRIEALRAIATLSMRLGQYKFQQYVLPVLNPLLHDSEDLVIVEAIKMFNQFVKMRLITQAQCIEVFQTMFPYLLHPNRQIREGVANYIVLISQPIAEGAISEAQRQPILSPEEFYCYVRCELRVFFHDNDKQDIYEVTKASDILSRLKPPLQTRTMVLYFKKFSEVPDNTLNRMVQNFQSDHFMTDHDTFAFTVLQDNLKAKLDHLRKRKNNNLNQDSDRMLQLQNQRNNDNKDHRPKVYRIVKASQIENLKGVEDFGTTKKFVQGKKLMPTEEVCEKASQLVKKYANAKEHFVAFDKVEKIQQTNFGMNLPSQSGTPVLKGVEFEFDQILRALKVVPNSVQTAQAFHSNTVAQKTNFVFNNNIEWKLPEPGPQSSNLQHFNPYIDHQTVKLNDHQAIFTPTRQNPLKKFRPQGTLVTTLYEHKNPVNTVTVCDDQRHFLTGSRKDKTIHIWRTDEIERDVKSRAADSIVVPGYVNKIEMIQNSNSLAVGSSAGLHVYDLNRSLSSRERPRNTGGSKGSQDWPLRTINLEGSYDEVTQVNNFTLPISNSNVLAYVTQNGGFYMHDVRAKSNILDQPDIFGCERGAISCMSVGQNTYQMTMGTLGGYVCVYDVRYNLVSSQFRHNLNNPILSLSQVYRPSESKDGMTAGQCLVSTGCANYELSQLNLETGKLERYFRSSETSENKLSQSDLTMLPEYIKETRYTDMNIKTLRRTTNSGLFTRALRSFHSHNSFASLWESQDEGWLRNIDTQLLKEFKNRYKSLKEAYESQSACRAILVPRQRGRLIFDAETANFAITGGNDRTIRYWNIGGGSTLHYNINSPDDKECTYTNEQGCGSEKTELIHQQMLATQDFPKYTPQKLMEKDAVTSNPAINYGDNKSAYHQAIASKVTQTQGGIESMREKLQAERKKDGNVAESMMVHGMQGLSQSQHLNDLSMNANFQELTPPPNAQAPERAGEQNSSLVYQFRKSETVAHSDTILDLATVEYTAGQYLLISASRDTTIKIWR